MDRVLDVLDDCFSLADERIYFGAAVDEFFGFELSLAGGRL